MKSQEKPQYLIKLKAKIVERGLTLQDLPPVVGVNPSTFSAKMNYQSKFSLDEIKKICAFLKLTEREIVDVFFSEPPILNEKGNQNLYDA